MMSEQILSSNWWLRITFNCLSLPSPLSLSRSLYLTISLSFCVCSLSTSPNISVIWDYFSISPRPNTINHKRFHFVSVSVHMCKAATLLCFPVKHIASRWQPQAHSSLLKSKRHNGIAFIRLPCSSSPLDCHFHMNAMWLKISVKSPHAPSVAAWIDSCAALWNNLCCHVHETYVFEGEISDSFSLALESWSRG